MKKYLVGGAVRDKILGLPINDKDYVVVGSNEEEMLSLGFQKVGKSFPVFLNENGEEHALARIEISTGNKHQDFVFKTNGVSLKEDLYRRDITINSLAEDENGNIIDYFNGIADLKKGVIRHVSEAFIEDPLRLFRVARFAAKFEFFTIADETISLLKNMVETGLLDSLSRERIFNEFNKSLQYEGFYRFLEVLFEVNAIKYIPIFKDMTLDSIKKIGYHMKHSNSKDIKNQNLYISAALFDSLEEKRSDFFDNEINYNLNQFILWFKIIRNIATVSDYEKLFNQKSISFLKFKIDDLVSSLMRNNLNYTLIKFNELNDLLKKPDINHKLIKKSFFEGLCSN